MGISIWELIILAVVAIALLRWFLRPVHRVSGERHAAHWGRYVLIAGGIFVALLVVPLVVVRLAYAPMRATGELREVRVPVPTSAAPAVVTEPEVSDGDPTLSLKPVPLPEPPVMLRPSTIVKAAPETPDIPPVVAVTSQWWADREQACRQASTQLFSELVALRTEEEQRFLAKREHLQAVATQLKWSGEVEATEKDFGNGLKATMYRVHLRVPSQDTFVEHLGVVMRAHSEEIRLIAAGAVFFDVTVLFGVLGWLLNRRKRRIAAAVAT